jgi:hypothetical protein
MSSVERLMDDRLEPLSQLAAGRYGERFLRAIDAALAVRPQDRPQTEAQFRALLDEPVAAPVMPVVPVTSTLAAVSVAPIAPVVPPPLRSAPALEDVPTRIVRVARTVPPGLPPRAEVPSTGPSAPAPTAAHAAHAALPSVATEPDTAPALPKPQRSTRRMPIYVAGAICMIAVIAAGLYFFEQRAGPQPRATPPSASLSATATPASASVSIAAPAPAATSTPPLVVEAPEPRAETPVTSVNAVPPPDANTPAHVRREPALRDSTPRAYSEPPTPRPAAALRPAATPTRDAGVRARCSDILQKASLEPLTGAEAEFLRRECR